VLACGVMRGSARGSLPNLRRSLALPLALAACVLIAACGGSGGKATAKVTAARLVSQAFHASGAVDSGRIAVALTLSLDGVKQLNGEPVTLDVSGPFQRDASGQIAADLSATIDAAGDNANLEIVLVPGHLYLGIGGTFYDLPRGGGADALGASGPSGAFGMGATGASGGIFGALGIDPHGVLTDLRDVGTAEIGGVETDHVSAQINVAGLLAAGAGLVNGSSIHLAPGTTIAGNGADNSAGSGSTGSTGATGLAGLLPLLAQAITSATADVYTGVDDHIVRRLDLAVKFSVPALAGAVLGGLTGGSVDLDATLTDLGKPQTITPPANAQPRSRLLNGVFDLESRFGSLASLFAAGTGGSFGGLFSRSGAGAATNS
jgi:hypothetical protein